MSVLIIIGPKRTLAASHAAPWYVPWCVVQYADGTSRTDGRTPDRCITLSARRDQRNKSH